ncbi:MAG: hypothetical protein AAF363_14445 [Bacteroidota bacterium]
MKEIRIPVPEGMKFESVTDNGRELLLVEQPLSLMERFKTVEDVLKAHNTSMEELDEMYAKTPERRKWEHIGELICACFNEGWTPDWANKNEWKYTMRFVMSPSGFRFNFYDLWLTFSLVGSRLCLKDAESARYIGETFPDVFKRFMI